MNYETEKGKYFFIISGDKRLPPILAHGDHEFLLENLPIGVKDWMESTSLGIKEVRKNNEKPSSIVTSLLETESLFQTPIDPDCCEECPNYPACLYEPDLGCGGINIGCDPDPDPCGTTTYYQEGPLMTTSWGQNCPYNLATPGSNCSDNCSNDHTLTGCVATATSQVIRYYEHPNNYNYAIMQNNLAIWDQNTPGAMEFSTLIFDVGDAIDMDWGCNGSSAHTYDVPAALENDFNYTYGGDFCNYSSPLPIKANINQGRPVIFATCRGTGCHAWVCDGYKGYYNNCYSYLYYHMNWGWNGIFDDWYFYNVWDPGNLNNPYDQNKRQIINIQP